MPHTSNKKKDVDPYAGRLSKRLCYILRYGAIKEGLNVQEGGFIDLKEVMTVSMMRHHTEQEALKEINNSLSFIDLKEVMTVSMMRHHTEQEALKEINSSLSHRRTQRFESKVENGKVYVRALYCRKFEPNPCHEGSAVPTLLQTCISYVSSNLQDYDLEDFPDEHIISTMIFQLKRQKKLNSANLRALLVPVLEHLDLYDVYVTAAVLKTLWTNCTNLRVLSLQQCGYVVTDHILETLLRKLPLLTSINLAGCNHLTEKSTTAMCKYGKELREVNLSLIKTMSENALLDLVTNCEQLVFLDIYDARLSDDIKLVMVEVARQRGITLVLKGLDKSDPDVTIENPSTMLPNFGKVW